MTPSKTSSTLPTAATFQAAVWLLAPHLRDEIAKGVREDIGEVILTLPPAPAPMAKKQAPSELWHEFETFLKTKTS